MPGKLLKGIKIQSKRYEYKIIDDNKQPDDWAGGDIDLVRSRFPEILQYGEQVIVGKPLISRKFKFSVVPRRAGSFKLKKLTIVMSGETCYTEFDQRTIERAANREKF